MDEIVRCSRRYVLCGEYRADDLEEVPYRGQEGALFRARLRPPVPGALPAAAAGRGGLPPARRRPVGRRDVLGLREAVIAIVDYGMGNLRSVLNAFERRGRRARSWSPSRPTCWPPSASCCPASARSGTRSRALRERGLAQALRDVAAAGRPVLGVCLGMQLLATRSSEFGEHEGLGPDPGLGRAASSTEPGLRIPHVGWNDLEVRRADAAPRRARAGADLLLRALLRVRPRRPGGRHRRDRLRPAGDGLRRRRATCSACSSTPRRAAPTASRC